MTERRIGPDGRDDILTHTLRRIYAPPTDPGYWDGLDARIMARLGAPEDAWWQPYGEWVRGGLIAAGVAGLLAGAGLARASNTEAHVAAATILETPRELPQQIATGTTGLSAHEATLRYVLEP
ncbi:MAG: hypothetical protein M3081_05555 [Gemmatimonadota bacterium]|nr:hypothetical protein [Gemmatimonadota bacterium]